jgi:hypothetical protein
MPTWKVHVSKCKSSKEKVPLAKYKIWSITFLTFTFGFSLIPHLKKWEVLQLLDIR